MATITIPSRLKKKVPPIDFHQIFLAVMISKNIEYEQYDWSITFCGDSRIKSLNNQYMGINAPTDVLSFPAGDLDPETGLTYLGDIIISLNQANSQAILAGHSLDVEISILIVHGMLHLLGYDHADELEKADMWKIQDHILQSLGIFAVIP